MNTQEVIGLARAYLQGLVGHEFDVLDVARPVSPEAAVNLAKIVSKLSPMVGNLIEFNTCEYLNDQEGFSAFGRWQRQDPGFPDTIFAGAVSPTPGFEIKAWFPLATEITARFKDSQNHFVQDQTYVAMLAWLPEFLIFGKPKIIDIVVMSGASVARARDLHYHNPPDYLVLEPGDTTARTINLQQTNTNGYKFQGTAAEAREAQSIVASWGIGGSTYLPTPEYQARLRELTSRFSYRLDTNFAKMDRIDHAEIETFKRRVHETVFHGRTIGDWNWLLSKGSDLAIRRELERHFDIRDVGEPVVE
ncbi:MULTISPECIES: hypothetical protein [Burkholderia]|uniref:hypothetical protein n=1 Tax=Burkholderia TaxID=32008 RepID=UPI00158A406E|nr:MULTISPECIES: hypothetical protein [Burkholderia]MDN7458581.1 hypothetical protein [Burkholderia cenocepacia]